MNWSSYLAVSPTGQVHIKDDLAFILGAVGPWRAVGKVKNDKSETFPQTRDSQGASYDPKPSVSHGKVQFFLIDWLMFTLSCDKIP